MVFLVEPVKSQFCARPVFLGRSRFDPLRDKRQRFDKVELPLGIIPREKHYRHLRALGKANASAVVLDFERAHVHAVHQIQESAIVQEQIEHAVIGNIP